MLFGYKKYITEDFYGQGNGSLIKMAADAGNKCNRSF